MGAAMVFRRKPRTPECRIYYICTWIWKQVEFVMILNTDTFSTLSKGNWRLSAIGYLDPPYNLSLSKLSHLLGSQISVFRYIESLGTNSWRKLYRLVEENEWDQHALHPLLPHHSIPHSPPPLPLQLRSATKSLLPSAKCVCLSFLRRRKKIPLFDYQNYCPFETFPVPDDENKMLRFLMVILF